MPSWWKQMKEPAMADQLLNKRIAAVVDNGFEQVELTKPRKALEDAGATVDLISPHAGSVKAWNHKDWGDTFDVDLPLADAHPEDYDALLLPGGVMSLDSCGLVLMPVSASRRSTTTADRSRRFVTARGR